MDLLRNAYYSGDSDEEPEPQKFEIPTSKRPKFDSAPTRTLTRPTRSTEAPIPGRYVSKRERAIILSAASVSAAPQPELVSASLGIYESIPILTYLMMLSVESFKIGDAL